MGKNKKNFRDELEKLAKITDLIEDSILSKADVKIIAELDEDDYRNVIKNFADIYKKSEEIVIDISGVKITFVLKK